MSDTKHFDFSHAGLSDVPLIVRTIQALRKLHTDSKVQTHKTQSAILRTLPPIVLAEVALRLADEEKAAGQIVEGQ